MINIAITGSRGRMGQRIYHLAKEDEILDVVSLIERSGHPELGLDVDGLKVENDTATLEKADVLITLPEATLGNIEACLKTNTKMVIGTTGLTEDKIAKIKEASEKIPIVFASNMSIGVNILFKLAEILGQKAGRNYKVSLTEAHHVHKKDAPSGTAKTLAQIVEQRRGEAVSDIKSIREGEIVGDHEVIFESDVDIIKISHQAKTRDIFAEGALVATKFLTDKEKGLFNMQDVLGMS